MFIPNPEIESDSHADCFILNPRGVEQSQNDENCVVVQMLSHLTVLNMLKSYKHAKIF